MKHKVYFDSELLRYIADGRNGKAKSMLNNDLANALDEFGTLLHYAAKAGNTEIVQFLIDLGSNVDCLGRGGKTPLVIAVDYRRVEIVKILLDAGASIDIRMANGETILQMTLRLRYFDTRIIQAFVQKVRAETSTTEELIDRLFIAGCTLHHATVLKDVGMVKGLLQRGSDVELKKQNGKTALHLAVEVKNFEIVQLLVDYGSDVDALDENGNSPLCYAARNTYVAIMQILLEEGADLNVKIRADEYKPLMFTLYSNEETDNVELLQKCVLRFFELGDVQQNSVYGASMDGCVIAHVAMLEMSSNLSIESIENEGQNLAAFSELKKHYDASQQILKNTVFESTPLLDLLVDSEHKMRIRVRNGEFVSKIENFCSDQNLSRLCPYYYIKLTRRVSKAARAVKLEDRAIPVICDIFQRNENECYVSARRIVGYLSERDLKLLCRVLE